MTKIIYPILIVAFIFSSIVVNANQTVSGFTEIELAFLKIFKEMENDFSFLEDKQTTSKDDHQKNYDNTFIQIPDIKQSHFTEVNGSFVRSLEGIFTYDLSNEEGKNQFDLLQESLENLKYYQIKSYHTDANNSHYTIYRAKKLMGVIIFTNKDEKASFKVCPFVQDRFISDLKKLIIIGTTNNFEQLKGGTSEHIADHQKISTFHFYYTNFSIYTDLSGGNYCHQSFFRNVPILVLHKLMVYGKSELQAIMGKDFKVLQNFNEKDPETQLSTQKIVIAYKEKTALIEINYHKGSQIISIVVGGDYSNIKKVH